MNGILFQGNASSVTELRKHGNTDPKTRGDHIYINIYIYIYIYVHIICKEYVLEEEGGSREDLHQLWIRIESGTCTGEEGSPREDFHQF